MFRALVVLAALFVSGAPIAYSLTRARSEWVRFTFESLAIGLLAQVTIGIVALRTGHYSRGLVAVMTCALVVGGAIVAWRRGPRAWPRLDLTLLMIVVGLVALALVLRRYPSYFAFRVGDMGGYVNRANQVAAGHSVALGNRPHGFTVFLAGTNTLLGQAGTVSGLPSIGVIFLLGTIALGKLLRLRTIAVAAMGLIVVVHPVTVWFSLFPVSEVLYSVLLISAVYFLVRARSDCSYAYAVVSGLSIGLMLFVRINALLLAPLLIVAFVASAVADDDARFRIQRTVTAAGLASLSVAYAYDVRYVTKYVVRQLRAKVIPDSMFDTADRLKLLEVSFTLVLTIVALLALVLLLVQLVRLSRSPRVQPPANAFWGAATASVVGIASVILLLSERGGVDDALARWGPALLVLAAAGIAVLVVRPGRYIDGAAGFFVVLTVVSYTVLFALRVHNARRAIYYLYWDRYLYSEVLPLGLVLVALALHALAGVCVDGEHRAPALRAAAVVGLVALIAVAVIPPAVQTRDSGIARQALYGDTYGKLSALDRLASADGDGPIVYSGARPPPPGWFFPNTKSAIARPLQDSFDRVIVGSKRYGANVLDRVFSPRAARAELLRAGHRTGYLVSLRPASGPRHPDDANTRYLGSVDYDVPILRRSLDRWSERFTTVPLHFDVYALQV